MVESYQIKINKCLVDPAEDEIKVYSQGGLDAFNLYFRRVNGVIYVYGGGNEQGLITPGAPVKVGDNPFNVDVNTYLPIFSQNDLLWSSVFVTLVAKKYRFIQFELDRVFDTH